MKKIVYIFLIFINVSIFGQNSYFFNDSSLHTKVKRNHRVFKMSRFAEHNVMYVKHTSLGDSLCDYVTDSLKFNADTLSIKICSLKFDWCSDTLVPKGETVVLLNNSYWQKIPIDRLYRIKSKHQPLARITSIITVLASTTFLGGLIVGLASKNDKHASIALNFSIIGDFTVIASTLTNIFLAKKRFKFNKFDIKNKYFVAF